MSELSGSLEDFPLPDVLRLLARGQKHGVLHVYGDVVRGRVYMDEGKISYATTRSTDDFAEGSGAEDRDNSDRRQLKLDEVGDEDPELLADFLSCKSPRCSFDLGERQAARSSSKMASRRKRQSKNPSSSMNCWPAPRRS